MMPLARLEALTSQPPQQHRSHHPEEVQEVWCSIQVCLAPRSLQRSRRHRVLCNRRPRMMGLATSVEVVEAEEEVVVTTLARLAVLTSQRQLPHRHRLPQPALAAFHSTRACLAQAHLHSRR